MIPTPCVAYVLARGTRPVIPQWPTTYQAHPFDPEPYKRRNLVERAVFRIMGFRRVATRYDKLACTHAATVALAAIIYWLL